MTFTGASSDMVETKSILKKALGIPGSGVHWYGKAESRVGRKMAHLTVTADNFGQLRERVELLGLTQEEHCLITPGPRVGIIMGSDSDLPTMKDAAEILDQFQVSYELTVVSAHRTPTRMYSYAQSAVDRGVQVIIAGAGGAAHLPGMHIFFSSQLLFTPSLPLFRSSRPFSLSSVTPLISHLVTNCLLSPPPHLPSTHQESLSASPNNLSQHHSLPPSFSLSLPHISVPLGMVAALTSLPIIGVPIKTQAMSGMDSLYSIVQMPKGIPVATVAIGNAANAGLLAVRILAAQDPSLLAKMDAYMMVQEEEVLGKAQRLEAIGHKEYLSTYLTK